MELPQNYSDSDSSLISPFLPIFVSSQRILKTTKKGSGKSFKKELKFGKHENKDKQKAQSTSFQMLFIKDKAKKHDLCMLRGSGLYMALHLKR